EGLGERATDLARGRLLEPHDEVTDVRVRESGPDEPEEEGNRERDQAGDLPPEDVVPHEVGRPRREGDNAVVDGPQRRDDDAYQDRREHPARTRRSAYEPPH